MTRIPRETMPGRRMNFVIAIIVLLLAALAGWRVALHLQTYHLATVDQGKLYRTGNRGRRAFENGLRRVHARTIVCLVDDKEMASEPFRSEAPCADAYKLTLVRIPVKLGGWPSDSDIRRFLAVATDPTRQPVIVHCAQGVRRTGMMVAAYQESILGYTKQQAKDAILRFGHSDRSIRDIQRFIDCYNPQTREMTQSFAATGNE